MLLADYIRFILYSTVSSSGSKVYPFKAIDGITLAIHFVTNSVSQNVLSLL